MALCGTKMPFSDLQPAVGQMAVRQPQIPVANLLVALQERMHQEAVVYAICSGGEHIRLQAPGFAGFGQAADPTCIFFALRGENLYAGREVFR